MVSKIIHTFWGGDRNIHECTCLKNWEEVLKPYGYEINVMTDSQVDKSDCEWVEFMYNNKQWAHLSDYYRFYLVKKYGGFWLDTDIFVHKPFDDLLGLDYIMAKARDKRYTKRHEYTNGYVHETCIPGFMCLSMFGMIENHWIADIALEHYNNMGGFTVETFNKFEMIIGRIIWKAFENAGVHIDYNTYLDFDDNTKVPISDILKKERENLDKVITLPSTFFDCCEKDKVFYHQYTSHLHYGLWTL